MPDEKVLWVLEDEDDELDRSLVEGLRGRLGDLVRLEVRRRSREAEGIAERLLRSVMSEWPRSLAEQLQEAQPSPTAVISGHVEDFELLAQIASRTGIRPLRIAVVREPALGPRWGAAPADVFAVLDEHLTAAVAPTLERRLRVTGVPVGDAFAPLDDLLEARRREGLSPEAHVLLVTADAIEPHELDQLLVQLRLVRAELEVLFEVRSAATAENLRRLAPAQGLSACLVPADAAGAKYWGLGHLIIGRARQLELCRSRAVGVPLLAAPPRDADERERAASLVASGAGRSVESIATLAVDIDLWLEPQRYERLAEETRRLVVADPAGRLASLVKESIEQGAELTRAPAGLPLRLERISAGKAEGGVDPGRFAEAAKAAREVRDRSESWRQRARIARSHGEEDLAQEADKRAARHHEVLDRLLESLRPVGWEGSREDPDLEEELEALRRQVVPEAGIEQRLRSLEVEDELRALKERLERE